MIDFKFRGRCDGCHKVRWFIRKRSVKIPTGQIAKSHDLFCDKCHKAVLVALQNSEKAHE